MLGGLLGLLRNKAWKKRFACWHLWVLSFQAIFLKLVSGGPVYSGPPPTICVGGLLASWLAVLLENQRTRKPATTHTDVGGGPEIHWATTYHPQK